MNSDRVGDAATHSSIRATTPINAYLTQHNADPKPYVWRAEGAEILAKIKRARAALDKAVAV
jgi:hypothetical protein